LEHEHLFAVNRSGERLFVHEETLEIRCDSAWTWGFARTNAADQPWASSIRPAVWLVRVGTHGRG
jgi:hypothetical protein